MYVQASKIKRWRKQGHCKDETLRSIGMKCMGNVDGFKSLYISSPYFQNNVNDIIVGFYNWIDFEFLP